MKLLKEEFFPTPPKLVKEMLAGLKTHADESILEPSAGKGDLIEALIEETKEHYHTLDPKRDDLDAVEIDPELRHILAGKGIRVVHDDFLTYDTLKLYDWILMNPPFSNGDVHLMKALELLKEGGTCVCLLNKETLENPYTNSRKALLRLLEDWKYESQVIRGAFKQAERKTGVDVVIVRVTKPNSEEQVNIQLDELMRDELTKDAPQDPDPQNALVDRDPIREAIKRCRVEQKIMLKILELHKIARPLLQEHLKLNDDDEERRRYESDSPILKLEITPNKYIEQIRVKYWRGLFHHPAFVGQLTSNLQRDLYSRVGNMKHYDFNEFNILALELEMSRKVLEGVRETILKLFDELSIKHSWTDEKSPNIHYYNGWKTNKAWKINKKVILPLHGVSESSWKYGPLYFEWHARQKLTDIEKCLDYLDGNRRSDQSTGDYLSTAQSRGQTRNIFLKHIKVTFYKKGTTHIEFLNPELLERLNIFGSRHKNWLPPGYGKTRYEDMDGEAREVIDSFQGKDAYQRTCERNDIDLLEMNHMRLIGCSA